MRYYIRANGKLSSITVSDTLSQYLIIAVGGEHVAYGKGKKLAQQWISRLANKSQVPERDVSQWVQAHIIDAIVDPVIHEKWISLQPTIAAKLKRKSERDASFRAYLSTPSSTPKTA